MLCFWSPLRRRDPRRRVVVERKRRKGGLATSTALSCSFVAGQNAKYEKTRHKNKQKKYMEKLDVVAFNFNSSARELFLHPYLYRLLLGYECIFTYVHILQLFSYSLWHYFGLTCVRVLVYKINCLNYVWVCFMIKKERQKYENLQISFT